MILIVSQSARWLVVSWLGRLLEIVSCFMCHSVVVVVTCCCQVMWLLTSSLLFVVARNVLWLVVICLAVAVVG